MLVIKHLLGYFILLVSYVFPRISTIWVFGGENNAKYLYYKLNEKAADINCIWISKLLQKSEMRKNMVMDLIYRGFIYAANYSESHYNPRRSQIKTELRYLFVTTPNR